VIPCLTLGRQVAIYTMHLCTGSVDHVRGELPTLISLRMHVATNAIIVCGCVNCNLIKGYEDDHPNKQASKEEDPTPVIESNFFSHKGTKIGFFL
jgi:hypothetical protein